jgi:hypothetical protein
MIETLLEPSTPEHVKYNTSISLDNIKNKCDIALSEYYKKSKKKP